MKDKSKEQIKIKYNIIISWCLTIIWAVVIFYLSSKTAEESSAQSQGMIYTFSGIFGVEINGFDLLETIDGIVRETAHGVEYFILGALVCNSVFLCLNYRKQEEMLLSAETGIEISDKFRILNTAVLSILVCFIYSLTDEIHQIPIPGRTFQLIDLAIDFAGIVIGVIFILLFHSRRKKKPTTSSYIRQA